MIYRKFQLIILTFWLAFYGLISGHTTKAQEPQTVPGRVHDSQIAQADPERAINGGCKMKYTRVYADASGESHFEDVEVKLAPVDFAPPAPPLNLSAFTPATRFGFLSAPPGWFGDWHPTPKRQILFYLKGEIEAEVSDGEVRRFVPGSVTLVEDTTGKGHRSRVVSDAEVIAAVVQLED